MARIALIASLGLSLVASTLASELSNELEAHYNGYPHTTPNVNAGVQANQAAPNKPQVNSFIPLVFSYTASRPSTIVTPAYGTPMAPAARIITVEQNGGPGDVPTYLFNGAKPAVENNYPSIFPAKTGRKLLEAQSITSAAAFANPIGTYGACLATAAVTAPLVSITAALNSPSFEDYKVALCTNLKNLTSSNTVRAGRRLHQITPPVLKLYGEVKKSSTTQFPMLTYVFDFTTRPLLTLLTKVQPTGSIPAGGTLSFVDCALYLPDGAFVRSAAGTCFDDTPVTNGVPQPVIVRLAAKSFYYGSGTLGANTGASGGTQVTPIVAFAVNLKDTVGAPLKSVAFQTGNGGQSTIVQNYGVYADASGIYPGQN